MANEIHTKSIEHIRKDVVDTQEKLRTIRFGGAGSRSRNVREGRNLRREVARSLTELRAREIKENQESQANIALNAKKA